MKNFLKSTPGKISMVALAVLLLAAAALCAAFFPIKDEEEA